MLPECLCTAMGEGVVLFECLWRIEVPQDRDQKLVGKSEDRFIEGEGLRVRLGRASMHVGE